MQKTFVAMSLAAAALAAVASTASAAPLKAQRAAARAWVLGQADATTLAYTTSQYPVSGGFDRVVLRGDDGRSRTVAAPAGCRISVAQNGLLAGPCDPAETVQTPSVVIRHLFVARLDGSLLRRFDAVSDVGADGVGPTAPTSVGAQWIGSLNSEYHARPWIDLVNWHSGETRRDTSATPGTVDDLNAPALEKPLCAPVQRVLNPDEVNPPEPTHYFGADVHGKYVLLEAGSGPWSLRRCGSTRPVSLPKGFQPRVLGSGWVAGYTQLLDGIRTDVVRLSDGRRWSMTGLSRGATGTLTLTRGRLYVTRASSIYTVKLPKA